MELTLILYGGEERYLVWRIYYNQYGIRIRWLSSYAAF